MFAKLLIAAITLPALLARADPNPIIPGPGDSYKEGGNCQIEWEPDTTGKWTNMLIELKTGDNYNMVSLQAITTIDGTKESKYTYPCPDVSPNSAIYFYEFSCSAVPDKYWTTRFTITDKDGKSTPPANSTQPNGDKIPWGVGSRIDSDNSTSTGSSSALSPSYSGSSSSLSGGSSSKLSSSRLSSTGTSSPTQTGTSQSNTNGGIVLAVPKAVLLVVGLLAAYTSL